VVSATAALSAGDPVIALATIQLILPEPATHTRVRRGGVWAADGSELVLPSACLRSRYARVTGSVRARESAMMWIARLSWRSPPRCRRWRVVCPSWRRSGGARVPTFGGFPDWAETVGGILSPAWARGFVANVVEFYDETTRTQSMERAASRSPQCLQREVVHNRKARRSDRSQPAAPARPSRALAGKRARPSFKLALGKALRAASLSLGISLSLGTWEHVSGTRVKCGNDTEVPFSQESLANPARAKRTTGVEPATFGLGS